MSKTLAVNLLLLSSLLCGCAARKNVGSPGRVIVPPDCISKLEKTAKTWCEISAKGELFCHDAAVTRVVGCEVVEVNPKNEKRK